MPQHIELGLDTFGDITLGTDGSPHSHAQVIRDVIEEAVLADEVGVDAFGVGEHHRPDFAVSTPDVVLAAIAGRTKRIVARLRRHSASSDDPIRVFQRFSTLNAASNGRAEVTLGRGSFIELFPLFGFELSDYEKLFEEKLDLFVAVLRNEAVTWKGSTRAPLTNQHVYPPIENGALRTGSIRTWIGVGGSPESVVRAAHYDLPLMLAIIGGDPKRFLPLCRSLSARLCAIRQARTARRRPLARLCRRHRRTSARGVLAALQSVMRDRIGGERGWPPTTKAAFEQEVGGGSLYLGSPETVARRIATTIKDLGAVRFDMKYSAGTLPHDKIMRCIELYGTKVIPLVRELTTA